MAARFLFFPLVRMWEKREEEENNHHVCHNTICHAGMRTGSFEELY